MFEVELRIKAPGAWIDRIASSLNSTVKVLECIPLEEGRGRFLIEIFPHEPKPGDFQERLEALREEFGMEVLPYKKNMLIADIEVKNSIISESLKTTNSFLMYERALPDHIIELHLIIKAEADLKRLLSILEDSGWSAELHSKTHVTVRNVVTEREEDVIKQALDEGYYEYPKRINLRDLSDKLGISHTTLNEILHRGEKKIIREYYSLEE